MATKLAKLDELQNVLSDTNDAIRGIKQFMKPFALSTTLKSFDIIKQKGFNVTDVLIWLCIIQVRGQSIFQSTRQCLDHLLISGEKCVYYRLMENPGINWRRLYEKIVLRYYEIVRTKAEPLATGAIRCFIIDDTLIEKTGKQIEGVSKVHDHVTNSFVLGLKMLLLAYWDGKNLLSIDYSLHREKGKKKNYGLTNKELRKQKSKNREKDSYAAERKAELDQSKIDIAIQMLKRACKLGLHADYVLTDSWFTCIDLIKTVRLMQKGIVHFLGMIVMNRHKFDYKGKSYTTAGLISLLERNSSQYSRKYKCRYIDVVVLHQGIEMRLFLVKYGNKGKFRAIVTTNLKLRFTEMMEIYKIRWSIEVLFKECKQYLRLGKCQSTNFDAQIASITITLITHTVLTLEKRFNAYQTMGALFRETQQQLLSQTLWERINEVILDLIRFLLELCEIDIDELMERILSNEAYEQEYTAMINVLKMIKSKDIVKQAV